VRRRTADPFDKTSASSVEPLRTSGRIYGSSDLDWEEIRESYPSAFLVSACLVGIPCRYDGDSCPHEQLQALAAQGDVLPLCPEVLGGLPTPRPPAEIQGGDGGDVLEGRARVVNIEGKDVTVEFLTGAQEALRVVRRWDIKEAILKAHSPSCGVGQIYDGSFSGHLVEGDGVTAALLKREGIIVTNEEEVR
jgi:uncharacterized protein YbbK (DUF523 family)